MINKILVPTDFSEQAENALRVAADIARKHNSEVYLLHMLDLPLQLIDGPMSGSKSELPEALFFMKLARQKFEKMINADYLKGITVHDTIEFDGTFDGIMGYAKKHNSDLIVMGSHGTDGLHDIFIGSNTEKVVRHSDIPVMAIKKRHTNFEIKNFIYALDFKAENHNAFKQAIAFAKANKVTLHALYINTPGDFRTTQEVENVMKTFINEEKGVLEDYTLNIYNDTSVESGILNFAETIDSELIGIGTHGRKGLAQFFNSSLSEDLVNHAKRPVITFKI